MAQTDGDNDNRMNEDLFVTVLDLSNNEQTPSFVHNNLLHYILLHLPHTEESKQELFRKLKSCSEKGTEFQKHVSEKFAQEYESGKAVWWYTQPSFIYYNLNRALREQDVEFLYATRRFLNDFYRQLRENHLNFDTEQTLYRGVAIDDFVLEDLQKNERKLVHFDQFLSTSIDEQVAMAFIRNPVGSKKGVLFHVNIGYGEKPTQDRPIACIEKLSQSPTEKEVIFAPSHVFRLDKIEKVTEKPSNSKRELDIYHIYLQLTSDRDLKLAENYKCMEREVYIDQNKPTNILQLAKLLRRLDKLDLAIKYYHLALADRILGEPLQYKVLIYTDLGLIYRLKKDYDNAAKYLDDAANTAEKGKILPHDLVFRTIIENRGLVYKYQGHFDEALERMMKVLCLQDKAGIGRCQERATTLNNIGALYCQLRQPQLALDHFNLVLLIQKEILPEYHDEIARTYNNMSSCYHLLENYQKAEDCAEKSLNIKLKIMPKNHQSIARTKGNLGLYQLELKKFGEAYDNLEYASEILTKLNPNDAELMEINNKKDLALKNIT